MTQNEFTEKWFKDISLDEEGLYSAEYDGNNICLRFRHHVACLSFVLPINVMKAFLEYEQTLRKDIRKVMKMGEFTENK